MTEPQRHQKVRQQPRFSVNALARYLVAPPARRRRLVRDQKRPKDFQTAYYREVQDALVEHLTSGTDKPLLDCRERLRRLPTAGGWEVQRRDTGFEALEVGQKLLSTLPLEGLTLRRAPERPTPLQVAGVSVSVRPEVLLFTSEPTKPKVGAIKLYFSKSEPLTDEPVRVEQARYTTTILYYYLRQRAALRGQEARVDHRLCFLVDIMGGKHFSAPASYKRRLEDVEAACTEIALLWEGL